MHRAPYGFEPFENCQACTWKSEQYFCALKPGALDKLDQMSFINIYPPGSVLFSEGQPPRGLFMICRGSVKLTVGSGEGKTLIVHVARDGEPLALSSVISGHEYRVTAETLEPSQVRFFKREDFLRFLAESHEACRRVCAHLSEECEFENEQIRAIGLSRSAAEKLAHLILTWCDQSGRPSSTGTRVQVLMTHHDIAQLIGTSRETVTRLLKHFRENGTVSVRGSAMTVHNRAALEALVSL
jgi:CRP/FNR family transcriptional regulator